MTMNSQIRTNIADRRYSIGGSDAWIIIGDNEAVLLRHCGERGKEIEREDLSGDFSVPLGVATRNLDLRSFEAITGGMPLGWYIVTVCYATAVILLGPWPWNLLLILTLLLSRDEVLRYGILNRWGSSS